MFIKTNQSQLIYLSLDETRKERVVDNPLAKPTMINRRETITHSLHKSTNLPNIFQPAPHLYNVVISIFCILLLHNIPPTYQQNLCPKACTCDEQNLEILCKESIGASGLPHTLNPNTKRMVINNAQTSQFSGLDYLGKLETIDLSYNKISLIDFKDITKNTNLISLNTSHNNIAELKDSLVITNLAESGYTTANVPYNVELFDFKTLKSSKINVIELILSNNFLTTIKNWTFIRWHRLQKLNLSYNLISTLEDQSLYGLGKLEIINLRGNRLLQVPTLALQGTIYSPILQTHSITPRISSLKILDLSENYFESIEQDSFSLFEKAQELYLESCAILNIHERAFKGLHTLYLLSLDKNNITEVPSMSFGYLGQLRLLKLNSNKITYLPPDSFTNLISLEELQVNNGTFKEVNKGVFNGLFYLKRLELAYNSNLTRIQHGTFESVPNLTYLNLCSNALTTILDNFNDKNATLDILDLRGNQLQCDCDLKWLTKWLKKFTEKARLIQQTNAISETNAPHYPSYEDTQSLLMNTLLTYELSNLTCAGPPALAGKLITELPDNKLECLEPSSNMNVQLGFASLFLMMTIMVVVCFTNFFRHKKHILFMLKENLVQNQMSMMSPYSENLHKSLDHLKKETQLYGADYEHVDYSNQQPQIYSIHGD